MNNTDLIRKLIREVFLIENYEEINKLYHDWKSAFEEDVKLIRVKEYKEILQNNPPPVDYSQYNNWLKQKVDLYSDRTIEDIFNILNGRIKKFTINSDKKRNVVQSYKLEDFTKSASFEFNPNIIFGNNPPPIRQNDNGENFIAQIINELGGVATKTEGQYDPYDVESNIGIFEVKAFHSNDQSIRAGASSAKHAIEFRNLLKSTVDDIYKFYTETVKFGEQSSTKENFESAINLIMKEIGKGSNITNYENIKKGNLPESRYRMVQNLIVAADSFKNEILNNNDKFLGKNSEKIIINNKSVEMKTPELKREYYKIIDHLNSLGANIEINKNDIDYITTLYKNNLLNEIENFRNTKLLIPQNSFLSNLQGLFIIKNESLIKYIGYNTINEHLVYDRVTVEKGSVRIKFKVK